MLLLRLLLLDIFSCASLAALVIVYITSATAAVDTVLVYNGTIAVVVDAIDDDDDV